MMLIIVDRLCINRCKDNDFFGNLIYYQEEKHVFMSKKLNYELFSSLKMYFFVKKSYVSKKNFIFALEF